MRTFDRQARQAAKKLLTGDAASEGSEQERSFAKVVEDREEDLRRLSLCYFTVPNSWADEDGAGLSFQKEDGIAHVAAKMDRLVIWRSSDIPMRQEPWNGSEAIPIASSLELHLVDNVKR